MGIKFCCNDKKNIEDSNGMSQSMTIKEEENMSLKKTQFDTFADFPIEKHFNINLSPIPIKVIESPDEIMITFKETKKNVSPFETNLRGNNEKQLESTSSKKEDIIENEVIKYKAEYGYKN